MMMIYRLFVPILAAVVIMACEPASGTEPTAPTPGSDEAETNEPNVDDRVAQAGPDIPTGQYPTIAFALLEQDERARFVGLAEAELCPCEGQVTSLETCLRAEETSCSLADSVGTMMMRMIKEDADDTEVSAGVQATIQVARQVHDIDVGDAPAKGAEDATVVIVEFSDFECPHCRALAPMLNEIVERFPNDVRVHFMQFPLQSHRNAALASAATLAAHQQGFFWEFHDLVFENQNTLQMSDNPTALFSNWAEELGLDMQRFATDCQDPAIIAQVARERETGIELQIDATPTIFINGIRYIDGMNVELIAERVQAVIADAAE